MSEITSKRPARVCIVGTHPLAVTYLATLLRKKPYWTVVEPKDHSSTQRIPRISVFVIDVASLPVPLSECITRLRALEDMARFIVIDNESMDAARLVNLRIQGFLTYQEVPRNLVTAVRAVIAGHTWVRPDLVRTFLDKALVPSNGGSANHNMLTERETEIMEFLKKRLSNAEIARHLGIRNSTVKFHISNLFSKLDVSSRRELLNREGAVKLWNNLLLYSSLPPS